MFHKLTKNFNFVNDQKLIPMLEKMEIYFQNDKYDEIPILARKITEYVFIEELGYSNKENLFTYIHRYKESYDDSFAIDALYQIKKWGNSYAHYNSDEDYAETLNFTNALYLVKSVSIFLQNIYRPRKSKTFTEVPYLKGEVNSLNPDTLLQQSITFDELRIKKEAIVSLLSQKHLILKIPFYQRKYTWNESQLTTLLEDIKLRNQDRYQHYFGVIAIKKELHDADNNVVIKIIDGQQRLTTAILFLKAAYNNILNRDLKSIEILDEIFQDKTLHKRYINESSKKGASRELEKILTTSSPLTFEWNYGKNYKLFYDFFNSMKSRQDIFDLVSVFATKFEIAELEYDVKPSREMDIFENMNSKGTELKEWDLIRNHIFNSISSKADIDDQQKVKIMEEEFEIRFRSGIVLKKQEDELSKFFQEFLWLKFASKNKKFIKFDRFPIYNNFKRYFNEEMKTIKSLDKYREFLNEIKSVGLIYKSLHCKDIKILNPDLELIFSRWRNLASKKQIYFVIFKIVLTFGEWDLEKWFFAETKNLFEIIKLLDSILVRLDIVKGFGHSLRNIAYDLFHEVKSNSWKAQIIDFVNKSELFNITNEEFENSLLKTKIKFPIVERILFELENFIIDQKSYGLKMFVEKPSLEHVMPQNNEKWKNYLSNISAKWEEDYKNTLHMIGNFYILPKKLNSTLSNKNFDTKKKELLKISSPLIRGDINLGLKPLKNIDQWNFNFIRERSKTIAKILMNHVYKI